ncbi:MAG: NADH-quinone oxidoreductase subunit [Pseudoduganella sp.]|jgi:formate dehydrogenase|nr:NADH-quinone oxidoreductase subunit [Pseudoduganella sp.]
MIPIAVQGASRERKRQGPKGRQPDAAALHAVQQLLGDAPRRRDLLIEYLHLIQDAHGCLSAAHLAALASELGLAQAEVFEVASFYHHFDIVREGETPPPPLTIRVCDGLSCEMAGAGDLLARLPALLGRDVRVLPSPCIGRCDQAPAALVGQRAVAPASCDSVLAATAEPVSTWGSDPMVGHVLSQCLSGARSVEAVMAELEASGLRGLGGAGFPAGRKWRIVRNEPGPRLMAVNIDEGEPGTFKDRFYLERAPGQFIEGMLIAAWAVGIEEIYIYLRDEYHDCRHLLQQALAGLPPSAPRVHLRRGAGAYICGEESAMIESIEGKRGMPRLRPPYVAQKGLFGRPTLEHNFETLYWVPEILARGAAWFTSHGRHGRTGLRSFSVSGRVKQPGVKLAPAGITLRELIDEFCGGMLDGHQLYAYLPGGASGGILPASMDNLPLDFDTLQPYGCFIGSAAIIVLSQHDSARAAASNMMRFFRHESCGQCTPCRAGTAKAAELMAAPLWDAGLLGELSQVMRDASICGLGQAAPNPVDCVLKYFPHEVSK